MSKHLCTACKVKCTHAGDKAPVYPANRVIVCSFQKKEMAKKLNQLPLFKAA